LRAVIADIPRHGHGRRVNSALYHRLHHITPLTFADFHSSSTVPPASSAHFVRRSRGGSLFCTLAGGFADSDRKCSISNTEQSDLNLALFDSIHPDRELAFFPAPLLKLTLRGAPPGSRGPGCRRGLAPGPFPLPLGSGEGTLKTLHTHQASVGNFGA